MPINVNVSLVKFIMKESNKKNVQMTSRTCSNQNSTLMEMQEKEYPFLDSDVSEILMTFLILRSLSFKRLSDLMKLEKLMTQFIESIIDL